MGDAVEKPAGQDMGKQGVKGGPAVPTPIAEQWAYLRFLGFGAWWAWIWLCYNSTEIMRMFPTGDQTPFVLQMYLLSTAGIACSMFAAAAMWRQVTSFLERRAFVIAGACMASLFTVLLGYSAVMGGGPFFAIAALLTGVGTSVLCLKAGCIYGSISLGDSLTAGGISLLLAAFLHYVGIGIPPELRLLFVAALPIVSALLLTMGDADPFPSAAPTEGELMARRSPERHMYRKLVAASALVAFTAGVGKGITSMVGDADVFARSGTLIVFCVGLLAIVIVAVVNHGDTVRGARRVYSGLIVLGIAMMLLSCFGFDVAFLSVGKECLWMVFSCFMAYMAFRYDFSAVRVFGIGQGVYFVASLAGWAVGGFLQPYYVDGVVRMGVGMALAFLVVLVLVYVFPENDLKRIMARSVDSEAAARARSADACAACRACTAAPTVVNGSVAGGASASGASGAAPRKEAKASVGGGGAAAGGAATWGAHRPLSQDAEGTPLVAVRDGEDASSLCDPSNPVYGLSARELEILDLFAQGRSANWIAEHLTISKNTVRTHLRAIYSKLDVHSRQELLDFLAGNRLE